MVNVDLLRILGFKFPWFLKKSNICSILHTFMYTILLLIFILLYTYVFLHKPVIAANNCIIFNRNDMVLRIKTTNIFYDLLSYSIQ